MKLQDYMDTLGSITMNFRTEGDIRGVSEAIENQDVGPVKEDYEWAITQVHGAIKENKGLLEIFPENESEEDREKIKNTEIRPKALSQHVARVRLDLKLLIRKSENISNTRVEVLTTLLQSLTSRLDITDLGGVFEDEEVYLKIEEQ